MAKHWEIQHGRGADILEGLGQDVRQRAKLGPPTPQLRADVARHEEAANSIIDRGVGIVAAEGVGLTGNQVLNRLSGAEQKSLAAARIGKNLVQMAEELETKTYLQAQGGGWQDYPRVQLTALVEDAVFWQVEHSALMTTRSRQRQTGMLPVGELRGGGFSKYDTLSSSPEVGGKLTMFVASNPGSHVEVIPVTVTGLVSPQTGEPQVSLDVFARR